MERQELLERTGAGFESEYRRGFCAGWGRAIEALYLMVGDEGLEFGIGYEHASEFLDDVLGAWRDTNPFRAIPAPSLAGE